MIETSLIKNCPGCKKQMQQFACQNNISSSEWYCAGCHISEDMNKEVATYFLENARR